MIHADNLTTCLPGSILMQLHHTFCLTLQPFLKSEESFGFKAPLCKFMLVSFWRDGSPTSWSHQKLDWHDTFFSPFPTSHFPFYCPVSIIFSFSELFIFFSLIIQDKHSVHFCKCIFSQLKMYILQRINIGKLIMFVDVSLSCSVEM